MDEFSIAGHDAGMFGGQMITPAKQDQVARFRFAELLTAHQRESYGDPRRL